MHYFFAGCVAGIIVDHSSPEIRDLLIRRVETNNNANNNSGIIIKHELTSVDMEDSFKLSTASGYIFVVLVLVTSYILMKYAVGIVCVVDTL
jgi:hypothetical protein